MHTPSRTLLALLTLAAIGLSACSSARAEDWLQLKFDARHSGNAPERSVPEQLGLVGAVPLSDGIYGSPVVADERIYVVDGSGTAWCIDAQSLEVRWKTETAGGRDNCNNVR